MSRNTRAANIPRRKVHKLCEICEKIDLDAAFKIEFPERRSQDGVVIHSRNIREFSIATCHLCRFLCSTYPEFRPLSRYTKYQLVAYPMLSVILKPISEPQPQPAHQKVVLAMKRVGKDDVESRRFIDLVECQESPLPSRSLFTQEIDPRRLWKSSFVREISPYPADLDSVKHWLEFCTNSHPKCLLNDQSLHAHSKLIDCHTRQIVKALPGREYVALSYVWGNAHVEHFWKDIHSQKGPISEIQYPLSLPEKLPRVVHDAILVVKNIGQQYLWVDQYCIDQLNKTEKLSEIEKMDLIYKGSSLTIIAAAGQDANYGLPGSSGPRFKDTQSKVVVGNKKLISSFANPTIAIRESRWMSRGWTLQEALFSKRRLYFSDDQLYFECDGMNCQESISLPLEDLPRDLFGRKLFATEPAKGVFSTGTENAFLDSVALYSARNLSYANDALNAFRGVLRAFEAAEPPLYHFWCLPTWPSAERVSPERYFGRSLLWEFSTNVTRRREFPSWSWLGWTGQARFPGSFNIEGRQNKTYFGDGDGGESVTPRKAFASDVEISIRRRDGSFLPLESMENAAQVTAEFEQSSPLLYFETAIFPFQLARPQELKLIAKIRATGTQKIMATLQSLAWDKYMRLTARQPQATGTQNDNSCTCKVGYVVRDPDFQIQKSQASDDRSHTKDGMGIEHMHFLLKTEDNICLVHSLRTPQHKLILVGTRGLEIRDFAYTSDLKLGSYKSRDSICLNFLIVRMQPGGNTAERVGFIRVRDTDGVKWEQVIKKNRQKIILG